MKRIFIMLVLLLLCGCAAETGEQPQRLTQRIVAGEPEAAPQAKSSSQASSTQVSGAEGSSQSGAESAPEEEIPQTPQGPSGGGDGGEAAASGGDYHRIKAEQDAVGLDKENLEADYRVGKLDEADFQAQKRALEDEEQALDAQKEPLKHSSSQELPGVSGSMEELLQKLQALEAEEDALEDEEDLLEEQYRSGALDRESYIQKQAEILRRDDWLDAQKEACEQALEAMGWDD